MEADVGVEVWLRVGVEVVVILVTLSAKRTRDLPLRLGG